MKKMITLLLLCILLTGCTWQDLKPDVWRGEHDNLIITLHMYPDEDGILPFSKPFCQISYVDMVVDPLAALGDKNMRTGTWHIDNQFLTLKLDNGAVILGIVVQNGILLGLGDGFLLDEYYAADD